MARWTYLVANLRGNAIAGELPLTGVRMSKVLNGAGQFKADLELGDPAMMEQPIFAMTRPAIRAIYALRDATAWWGGVLWASDYDSGPMTMAMAGADFLSYFDHRKVVEVLPSPPIATTYVAGLSKIYTATDQNDIARDLVTLAQSHTAGDIGMTFAATTDSGILLDRSYHGHEMFYTGEALRELANLPEGPDIAFDVVGPDATGRPIRVMRLGTPRLVQAGAPHRFDLGGNLLSYVWRSGGGVMSTRVFYEGTGSDRGARIAVAEETGLYADGWPLLETDQIDATVTSDVTLQTKAAGLQQALRLPAVSMELKVRGDLPPTLTEYAPGDECVMVVDAGRDPLHPGGIEVSLRIASIEVAIDAEGQEDITLFCRVTGTEVT